MRAVVLLVAALVLPLLAPAASATVIPWHLQGWNYRAIVKPAGPGWNLVDLSNTPSFLQNTRSDLSDVRVVADNGKALPFYVAEYSRYDGVVVLAVKVPDPPPAYIIIYWGVGSTATVSPAYIYAPRQEAGELGCIVFDNYYPDALAIYQADLGWAKTWTGNESIWAISADTWQPMSYQVLRRSSTSVTLVVNATAPVILVWGATAPASETQLVETKAEITVTERSGNTLTDYAVKVALDAGNFNAWDWLASDCSDVYFTDANGNPLYYWVEVCDVANKKLVAWVKVPYLPANGQTTIYMHYGGTNPYAGYNDPDKVFLFFDDFEAWSGWSQYGSGRVLQDTTYVYMGSYSLKKDTYCDPNGGYKLLPASYTVTDKIGLALEVWDYRSTNPGCNADRFGLEDSSFNGYTVIIDRAGSKVGIDVRTSGKASNIYTASATLRLQPYFVRLVVFQGKQEVQLYSDVEMTNLVASYTLHDTKYNTFDRVTVRGGYPYWLDNIRVRPYVEPEPAVSVNTFSGVVGSVSQGAPVAASVVLSESVASGVSVEVWPVKAPGVEAGGVPAANASLGAVLSAVPPWLREAVAYGLALLPLLLVPAGYAGAGVAASTAIAWAVSAAGYAPWTLPLLQALAAVAALAVAVAQRKD